MSRLPFPERVLHQHIATLGKTGSGKSSALRVIAEHLLDKGRRVAIVDPKGDWWGLKSSADGKSAGYPVIMFGDFKEPRAQDVPLNDRSGQHVAELIATGNRNPPARRSIVKRSAKRPAISGPHAIVISSICRRAIC